MEQILRQAYAVVNMFSTGREATKTSSGTVWRFFGDECCPCVIHHPSYIVLVITSSQYIIVAQDSDVSCNLSSSNREVELSILMVHVTSPPSDFLGAEFHIDAAIQHRDFAPSPRHRTQIPQRCLSLPARSRTSSSSCVCSTPTYVLEHRRESSDERDGGIGDEVKDGH